MNTLRITFLAVAAALAAEAASAKLIEVVTEPAGAACRVTQKAHSRGFLPETPGFVEVETEAPGLRVTCRLPGFKPAVYEIGDPDAFSVDRDEPMSLHNLNRTRAKLRKTDSIFLRLWPR